MSTAGDRIRAYADAHHRHVVRFVHDPVTRDWYEVCDTDAGDRCDMTVAYRHAAQIADES